ncbi:MAG: sulfotransferase [Owenweeksia sp.]|nr:sulfotransferase [Owenweeksia sp.]
MKEDLNSLPLAEVCARQWQACVEIAREDLGRIDQNQVYQLRYEDFVNAPEAELGKVMEFLGSKPSGEQLQRAVEKVSPRSIGNYKKHLNKETLSRLEPIIEPVMKKLSDQVKAG